MAHGSREGREIAGQKEISDDKPAMAIEVLGRGVRCRWLSDDGGYGAASVSAAMIPVCEEFCGPEVSCDDQCQFWNGYNYESTNCSEFNGGAANNQCNTCAFDCSIFSPPGTECWWDGELSDCETDGTYGDCGDDVCQNGWIGEGCDNCPGDCGPCPDIECGDSQCDPGETFVTCDEDCDDPDESGSCGDGICSKDGSEDDDEDPNFCPSDCGAPNERCDDEYDCGDGYLCATRGIPLGGRCFMLTLLGHFDPCDAAGQCNSGYTCVEIDAYPDPTPFPVCLPELN